ncbi:MAG: DUF2889 domain-containing protein, partial [Acidimicrobiia bacterium]
MNKFTIRAGVKNPLPVTAPRRTDSVRRTSHMDIGPPTATSPLMLNGWARDLRTRSDGTAEVIDSASVRAVVGADRTLASLETSPANPAAQELVGVGVGRGFRERLDALVPEERSAKTLLYLLLDELPVTALISGYATLYSGGLGGGGGKGMQSDICAGWRHDGTMMISSRERGEIPVPLGPPANRIERPDDELSWHEVTDLPVGWMRRRRLIDVARGATEADPLVVWAMFRDTHVDADGEETVLHEYTLDASFDDTTGLMLTSQATPQVLPWDECPGAVASASRLVGKEISQIRDFVRTDFRGITTCTHLNDLVRSLGDLDALA